MSDQRTKPHRLRQGQRVTHRVTGKVGTIDKRISPSSVRVSWAQAGQGLAYPRDLIPLDQERTPVPVRQVEALLSAIDRVVPERIAGMHPNLLALYDAAQAMRAYIEAEPKPRA
jgi:hypothetical protein